LANKLNLMLLRMVDASVVARSLGESFGRFIVLAGVLGTRAGGASRAWVLDVRWVG
jgi:hypothetical protein